MVELTTTDKIIKIAIPLISIIVSIIMIIVGASHIHADCISEGYFISPDVWLIVNGTIIILFSIITYIWYQSIQYFKTYMIGVLGII